MNPTERAKTPKSHTGRVFMQYQGKGECQIYTPSCQLLTTEVIDKMITNLQEMYFISIIRDQYNNGRKPSTTGMVSIFNVQ